MTTEPKTTSRPRLDLGPPTFVAAAALAFLTIGGLQALTLLRASQPLIDLGASELVADLFRAHVIRRAVVGLLIGTALAVSYVAWVGIKRAFEPRRMASSCLLFIPLFFAAGWSIEQLAAVVE